MKRRELLKFGAAGFVSAMSGITGLVAWSPRAQAATIYKTFYITDGLIEQGDGVYVYFRGFSQTSSTLNIPGKSILIQQGDTVNVTIINTLSSTHSFVIDGVVDSGPISAGDSKVIQFVMNNAGSYLYYDNMSAPYNRVLGLHGGIGVMPSGSSDELYTGSPTFSQQYFWLFNDIDPVWNSSLQNGQTPTTAFKPRYFTINGLSGKPPGDPDHGVDAIDSMKNHDTALHGHVGDRTLIRVFNPGLCSHSVHWHANHVEWLTKNGSILPDIWKKDIVYLNHDLGQIDVIYPFEPPPDAYPPVSVGEYPMHLHDEMTQTAGGGLYMFGALTDIFFE